MAYENAQKNDSTACKNRKIYCTLVELFYGTVGHKGLIGSAELLPRI